MDLTLKRVKQGQPTTGKEEEVGSTHSSESNHLSIRAGRKVGYGASIKGAAKQDAEQDSK